MDTRAAHGGEPGALATSRAKAGRPEVVGSNPTGPTNDCGDSPRAFRDKLAMVEHFRTLCGRQTAEGTFGIETTLFKVLASVSKPFQQTIVVYHNRFTEPT